eukprot:scaffold978_cov392-Prasinococcus_capsulatus_cf.AAC.2
MILTSLSVHALSGSGFSGEYQSVPPGFERGILFQVHQDDGEDNAPAPEATKQSREPDRGGAFNFSAMFDAVLEEEDDEEEEVEQVQERPSTLLSLIDEERQPDKEEAVSTDNEALDTLLRTKDIPTARRERRLQAPLDYTMRRGDVWATDRPIENLEVCPALICR